MLTITGTADHLEVRRSAEPSSIATAGAHVGAAIPSNAHVGAVASRNAHVGAPTKLDAAILGTQAKEALVGLGWKPAMPRLLPRLPPRRLVRARHSSG